MLFSLKLGTPKNSFVQRNNIIYFNNFPQSGAYKLYVPSMEYIKKILALLKA